jgi:hypothetical protein
MSMAPRGLLFLLLLLLPVGTAAQEVVGPPGDREAAKLAPLESAVPLKVEVVFTRNQGEREVDRWPFTLLLNSDNTFAGLKMGLMVPITVRTKDVPATTMFKDVVTGVRCRARPLSGGRFALACEFHQDSVHSSEGEDAASAKTDAASTAPVIRKFYSETTLVLRDGQTAKHSATDPLSGEVLEVDVTLTVME